MTASLIIGDAVRAPLIAARLAGAECFTAQPAAGQVTLRQIDET